MRDAERRGAAFLVRRNGRATELGPTLDRIPDAAVSASHKACIGWTLREDGQSHVWFSRGLDGPGVELARLASGTAVDVDCREQTVWVFNREGLLYRARADDLERFQVRGDGPWTYRGRCAVSVWKTDLVVTCGGEELDRAPVPTVADLADARVTLTNGLDKGGWIGFHAPEDDFLYVREVKGGRLVGDWRRIASDRAVESLSLTMSRRHLCAAWTDPTALHAEVSPTKMSCIPR